MVAKERLKSKSSLEHQDFVTRAISKMVEVGAASALPIGVIPMVVSPLAVLFSNLTRITCVLP